MALRATKGEEDAIGNVVKSMICEASSTEFRMALRATKGDEGAIGNVVKSMICEASTTERLRGAFFSILLG